MAETDQEWLDRMAPILELRQARLIGDDRYAGLAAMIFTTRLVVGEIGNEGWYLDGWCYDSFEDAYDALFAWDGTGEPTGWHRHPSSGRRVARTGNEIDDHGNRVEVGQMYVLR
jgi:hypothetical protein